MRVQFLTRCVRTVHIAAPSSPGPWIARREEYVYWVQWIWSLHKSVNYNENGERHSPFSSPKAFLCAQISRWHLRRFRPLSLAAHVRSFCRKYLPRSSTGYACNLRVSRKGRKHASSRRFQNPDIWTRYRDKDLTLRFSKGQSCRAFLLPPRRAVTFWDSGCECLSKISMWKSLPNPNVTFSIFFVLTWNLNLASSAADTQPVSSTAAAATPALLLLYSTFESSAGLERKRMLEHKLESISYESMSIV